MQNGPTPLQMSRRWPAASAALIAALLVVAQPCLSDALLENGLYAGSLVDDQVTYGWFIETEERGLAFKATLSDQIAAKAHPQSPNQPDFVVFVAARQLLIKGTLNRELFSFLTETQITQLQTAGLGQVDCAPTTFGTEGFQVVTFVTVRLDHRSSSDADTALLDDCVRKVLRVID